MQPIPFDGLNIATENEMFKLTLNKLFEIMRPRFKDFPCNYLVFDIETTGTRRHDVNSKHFDGDLIVELGFCQVVNCEVTVNDSFILNWFKVDGINTSALEERLKETKEHVETDKNGNPSGKVYHFTSDRVRNEGVDPLTVLSSFADLLRATQDKGSFFVGHNGYFFDVPFIESHIKFWCKNDFRFDDNCLLDSGMVAKAAQSNLIPWVGDTLKSWAKRVADARLKGLYWSLDNYCVPTFRLKEKYNLDTAMAHSSKYDSYVTHLLVEEYKKLVM